jgi:hypothetical protein
VDPQGHRKEKAIDPAQRHNGRDDGAKPVFLSTRDGVGSTIIIESTKIRPVGHPAGAYYVSPGWDMPADIPRLSKNFVREYNFTFGQLQSLTPKFYELSQIHHLLFLREGQPSNATF